MERRVGTLVKRKAPLLDLRACTDCESCLTVCPAVFRRNADTGWIEVLDLDEYPEPEVEEAMSLCPADCIAWDDA